MTNDFAGAKQEILIVSPFMRKKRVETVLECLKESLKAGVSITIITRLIEFYKEKDRIIECVELLQPTISVIQRPNIHQKYIIVDKRLVWYGSINLLSFGSSEESIMRLESREIAVELTELVKEK
jgi:phosphatidylserine/phosphatidylglycerophosphate/cardiolipin synthase-like enzyme